MFTHILTNFKKEDNEELEINYVRLLGFNKKGRSYLNKIKKDMKIPVVTGYNKINDKIFNIEKRVSYIYSLLIVNSDSYLEEENKNKPIILIWWLGFIFGNVDSSKYHGLFLLHQNTYKNFKQQLRLFL